VDYLVNSRSISHFSVMAIPFLERLRPFASWLWLFFMMTLFVSPIVLANKSSASVTDYAPDIRRILARGELIVALPNRDQPPFFYEKNGNLEGIDVDLVRGLAHEFQLGIRFHRGAGSQDELIDVISRGEADIGIGKLTRTFHRALSVRFSDPYLTLRHALALNQLRIAELTKGDDMRAVIKKFPGTIGVLTKTAYADLARRNFPQAKIIEFSRWEDAISAVKKGKVDALYRDEFEIKRLMKVDTRNLLLLKAVVLTDTRSPLSIAVHHDNQQLLSIINLYLSQQTLPPNVDALLMHIPVNLEQKIH
jgi:polar amino acid transport system substrate-binding protein